MSGATVSNALRQLRNRIPDADQLVAFYNRDAPARIVQVCRAVVTAVDDAATPVRHTLSGLDDQGNAVAQLTLTNGIAPDGEALPIGTPVMAFNLTDGSWSLLTGVVGGATTMPAHSHTGGEDGPEIGILS